jgi:hypothetical protein
MVAWLNRSLGQAKTASSRAPGVSTAAAQWRRLLLRARRALTAPVPVAAAAGLWRHPPASEDQQQAVAPTRKGSSSRVDDQGGLWDGRAFFDWVDREERQGEIRFDLKE